MDDIQYIKSIDCGIFKATSLDDNFYLDKARLENIIARYILKDYSRNEIMSLSKQLKIRLKVNILEVKDFRNKHNPINLLGKEGIKLIEKLDEMKEGEVISFSTKKNFEFKHFFVFKKREE